MSKEMELYDAFSAAVPYDGILITKFRIANQPDNTAAIAYQAIINQNKNTPYTDFALAATRNENFTVLFTRANERIR